MQPDQLCRVLSIQSHVVSGYVGNKSATFPMQLLGFDVDAINSVQFSNHTGYPVFKGQVLGSCELNDIYEGLKVNNLLRYSHLLTGYIGSESFLLKVKEIAVELKRINPQLTYVCDPVMGDHGKLYVPKELLPVYQKEILPLADVITPNQFEAELLTGIKIDSVATVKLAMQKLHQMGAPTVIISSSDLGSRDTLLGFASAQPNGVSSAVRIEMSRVPMDFTGSGDLFTSLLLAWLHRTPGDLKTACEKATSTMQHVLKRTYQHAQGVATSPGKHQIELQLIQSKLDIEQPEICVRLSPL